MPGKMAQARGEDEYSEDSQSAIEDPVREERDLDHPLTLADMNIIAADKKKHFFLPLLT